MNHSHIQLLLADHRDLRGTERREVDAHVTTCTSCAARLAEYRAMDADLQSLQDARPTPALRTAYYEAVERNGQGSAARRTPVPRTQVRHTPWFYGIASVGAVLLLVAAVWMLLQPNLGAPWHRRSQGIVPAAKSAEVGSFVWQTDGVYGYEMLRPAGWSLADLGTARSYATSIQGSALELVAINLAARAYDESSPEGFRDIKARFDAAPNLADWVKSAEEMWANYGPPITWIADAPNAVIFQQQYDPTSRVAVMLIALAVKDGQPLILLLNAGGQYGSVEALQSRGIWDDFLTMIDSASSIPSDADNVQPWAPTATATANAPLPAVTPAPTALPVFTPESAPTPTAALPPTPTATQ